MALSESGFSSKSRKSRFITPSHSNASPLPVSILPDSVSQRSSVQPDMAFRRGEHSPMSPVTQPPDVARRWSGWIVKERCSHCWKYLMPIQMIFVLHLTVGSWPSEEMWTSGQSI